MTRKFIIDTDTASDDAVAIVMALRWPDIDVLALTTVCGNVPLEQATINALYSAQMAGSDVPVYPGAAKPLLREFESGQFFHGSDGMGEQHYPAPNRQAESKHAVDALIDIINANPGIELITLGPLTNIALAVSKDPNIVHNVSRCIVMGGAAAAMGNVTPAAEFNIWVDPDAAEIVFESGLPIEMVGWELCRLEANINAEEMDYIRGLDTPLGHFTLDCNKVAIQANFDQSGDRGMSLPDPVAMAVALDPTICTRLGKHYVMVETNSELTRGMTVVDQWNVTGDERNMPVWGKVRRGKMNVSVCWEIDIPRWKEMLYTVLR